MNLIHQCCIDARLYLHPPYRASDVDTSAGERILSVALNEWHMAVKDQLITIRYCPWYGARLPWLAVAADNTTERGRLPLYTTT